MDREPFDPESLNDPVAAKTSWTPRKSGGTNFGTHVLMNRGLDRLAFRPALGALLFSSMFIATGVVIVVAMLSHTGPATPVATYVVAVVFGLVFSGSGAGVLWSHTRPIVFDRTRGLYWKGWTAPRAGVGECVELDSVHALQVISERCRGFRSYELNLVLTDGTRLNVLDHGDLARIRRDGRTIARFLAVPLWDPE